jgi:hypothetical protein
MYKEILVGEYSGYFIKEDGKVDTYDNGKKVTFPTPEKILTGFAGHPWANVIGESGQVYHLKGDSTEVKKVPVTGAASSTAYYTHHVIVGKDGSLTVYTDDLKAVKLKTPGKIVQAVAAAVLLVRDEKGGVWWYNWIKTGKEVKSHAELEALIPAKINMPPATDISTSRSLFSGAIVNGEPWVWCDTFGAPYVGLTKAQISPVNMSLAWGLKEKITSMVFSDNTIHMITESGELLGMGNNWVGEVGNGQIHPKVLAGNADMGNRLFVPKPVNIGRGRKYKKMCSGTYYGFRHYAQEVSGQWSAWGYAKFRLLAYGVGPVDDPANVGISAVPIPWRTSFPDVQRSIATKDFVRQANGSVLAEGKPYPPIEPNLEPVPVPNKPPVVNAGQDIEVELPAGKIKLSAEAMDTDGTISSYEWLQVAGSAVVIKDGDTATPTIDIKEMGQYEFEVVAKDNKGAAAKDRVVVWVKPKPEKLTNIIRVYDSGRIEVELINP